MEHTKGPWSVQFESEYSGGDIFGRRKTESGEVKDYICTTSGNARADAHYIVACVNQCDKLGFSAEDIEEGAIEGLMEALVDNNEFLALLLAHLPTGLKSLQRETNNHINVGKAALAKVRKV